jgi:uncharacterized integral membrane protein (TIGR00697 family)
MSVPITLNAQHRASINVMILVFTFSSIVMAANIVGQKPLAIFGLIVSAGSAIFPITFLITAIITEVYGRRVANQVIFIGLIMNLLMATFIQATIYLPFPSFWHRQEEYQLVMASSINIYVMSSVAYILSEFTNVYVFSYLSKKFKGKAFLLRLFISTVLALTIDTLALVPIMLKSSPTYGILIKKFISLVLFKLLFIACGAPFAGIIKRKIKKSEDNSISAWKQTLHLENSQGEKLNSDNKITYIMQAKRGLNARV